MDKMSESRRGKGYSILSLVIVLMLFLSLILFAFPNNSANLVAVKPPINSGIGNYETSNCSTYLKSENITLDLYNKTTKGVGKYIFENPSEEKENLTIFFDPSFEPKSVKVLVDGEEINTWKEELNESYYEDNGLNVPYPVVFFNFTIASGNTNKLTIEWEMDSYDVDSYWQGYFYKSEYKWQVSYLMISKEGWDRPIERLDITIDIHTSNFDDPYIDAGQVDRLIRKTNSEGYPRIYLIYKDWYEPNQKIIIEGNKKEHYYYPDIKVDKPANVSTGEKIKINASFTHNSKKIHPGYTIFEEVKIYYKKENETNFKSKEMKARDDHFSVNISAPEDPTKLEFYIEANYFFNEGGSFENTTQIYTIDVYEKKIPSPGLPLLLTIIVLISIIKDIDRKIS